MQNNKKFLGGEKIRNVTMAGAAVLAFLVGNAAPSSAFSVDGRIEAGEYDFGWEISADISGATSENSKLFVRQTGNDVYLAISIDIAFVDNVYGERWDPNSPTETPGSGWETKNHKLEKLISSDDLVFDLNLGNGSTTYGVELVKKNCGGGAVQCSDLDKNTITQGPLSDDDVATSFNYNYLRSLTESGFGDFSNKHTSKSPDPLFDQPGGEAGLEPHPDWIQELVYEYHFVAEPGKIIGLADISNVDIHASPRKQGSSQDTSCVDTNSCDPTDPPGTTEVAEPGAIAFYALGLAGLGYVRRRRKAS